VASDARDFMDRFVAAINAQDADTAVAMVHPDFIGDTPQSGERSVGRAGFSAQLRNYPGIEDNPIAVDDAQLLSSDDERYAMTPGFTVVQLAAPNTFTVVFRTRYPDGKWWRMLLNVELRDHMLYRMENYFAPELPAPLAESMATYSPG
jgi:hypothetical protein